MNLVRDIVQMKISCTKVMIQIRMMKELLLHQMQEVKISLDPMNYGPVC